MMTPRLIIPCLLLAMAGSAFASGATPTRPPRPPRSGQSAPAERIDDGKYALGKAVFTGKSSLARNNRAGKQERARLEELARQSGNAGRHLPSLAGRLSADQLDALAYYVAHRYPAGVPRR